MSLGIPFATRGRAPGSGVLRHCIAAVKSRSGAPDVSRSATSLEAKWEKTAKNPATFTTKEPPRHLADTRSIAGTNR